MSIFKDEAGNDVSFKWWIKWHLAKYHLRKWLEYEGMPKGIKDFQLIKSYLDKNARL